MSSVEAISIVVGLVGIGVALLVASQRILCIAFLGLALEITALAVFSGKAALLASGAIIALTILAVLFEVRSFRRSQIAVTALERCRLLGNGWMFALALSTWNPRPGQELERLSSSIQAWQDETESVLREHVGEEAIFRFRNHDGLPPPDLSEIGRRPE